MVIVYSNCLYLCLWEEKICILSNLFHIYEISFLIYDNYRDFYYKNNKDFRSLSVNLSVRNISI